MLVCPSFSFLGGRLLLNYLGLEGLGVFVVLVFVFFCSSFVFVCFGLFWFCCWIVVGLLLVLFLFFFGFVWATSPGPKPSFFLFFGVFLRFPFFAFNWKTCSPPQKKVAFVVNVSVFPFVSLWPFIGLPLIHLLFLCISLVIFFLPCFLLLIYMSGSCFLLLVCLLFVSRSSFVFVFVACCLVLFLNHNLRFVFALHLVSCCCLLLSYFLFFVFVCLSKKTPLKKWKLQKNGKCTKNGHFDKSS